MLPPKQLIILLLPVIFYACNNSNKYPYTIKNFDKKLQPHLTRIVEEGIVIGKDRALANMATDAALVKLGNSEHPILRATAFNEMLYRKSFNHTDIILGHLDDTAVVFVNQGEFGVWDMTVSDHILQEASWKTKDAKMKTVEQVLTNHNYLRSAYSILERLEPQEKYYTIIKHMATRPRRLGSYEDYELGFSEIEYALYGLAKFKRKEDIILIKNKMMKHVWELGYMSFQLMQEFPDTAYFDVLQTYHRRQFYKFSGNRPGGFSGVIADRAAPEDFIDALVIQQSNRSAQLLDTMLTRLPLEKCMPGYESILDVLIIGIWEHPCKAYTALREKIKPRAEELLGNWIELPLDSSIMKEEPTKRIYYWNR